MLQCKLPKRAYDPWNPVSRILQVRIFNFHGRLGGSTFLPSMPFQWRFKPIESRTYTPGLPLLLLPYPAPVGLPNAQPGIGWPVEPHLVYAALAGELCTL
jgi:hypothetical protein